MSTMGWGPCIIPLGLCGADLFFSCVKSHDDTYDHVCRLEAQQTLAAAMAAQLVKPQAWLQQGPARDGSKCAPVQPVWLEMPRGVQKASW